MRLPTFTGVDLVTLHLQRSNSLLLLGLQELAKLLHELKAGGHKALIFTQMTKMLDVLEAFLNLHAYTYLRLDGTTKPEQRQVCRAMSCFRPYAL